MPPAGQSLDHQSIKLTCSCLLAGVEVRDVPGQSSGSFPDQEGSDQSEDRPFFLLAPEVRTDVIGSYEG